MLEVFHRPQFLLDVAEEVGWLTDHAGAGVAARWHAAVWDTILDLRRQPFIGRERRDLHPEGTRTWRLKQFPRWLLFYRVREGALVVLRVRHGAMNLTVMDFGA